MGGVFFLRGAKGRWVWCGGGREMMQNALRALKKQVEEMCCELKKTKREKSGCARGQ